MKVIKGHRAWNFEEVVEFFKRDGMFTMCNLPHYRYDRVKGHCKHLKKLGMIKRHAVSDMAVHWLITENFQRWVIEKDLGITNLGVQKWVKQKE